MGSSLDNRYSDVVDITDFRICRKAQHFDLSRPLRENQPPEQTVAKEDIRPPARILYPDFTNNPFSRKPPDGGYDTQIYFLPLLEAIVPDPIARNFLLEDRIAQLILYTLQTCRRNDQFYSVTYLRRCVREQFGDLRSDKLSGAMRKLTELGFTYYRKPKQSRDVRFYLRDEFRYGTHRGRLLSKILLAPYVVEALS